MDALQLVELTRQRLVDLATSENYVRDAALADAASEIWRGPGQQGGLVSDLWIQGAYPSKLSTDSLRSLANEGIFPNELCEHLDKTGKFPSDRLLFTHQSDALRHAGKYWPGEKPSIVITAGTGAGKTEAFLLPILAGLWRQPRANEERGMRCLILYPMNALVTDQVTRLYELLKDQNSLSLFHFTSETPEADRNVKPGEDWNPCRRRSRQAARANIPDIVITNYSMLEYMLCRPQDHAFFGPALRYVVLDEAHLYTGTLAAEITLLLRRVRDRCQLSPEQVTNIATSATLGGSVQDLENFAATVFSVPQELIKVLRGIPAPLPNVPELSTKGVPDADKLAEYSGIDVVTLNAEGAFIEPDEEGVDRVRPVLSALLGNRVLPSAVGSVGLALAPLLKLSLEQVPIVHRLMKLVFDHNLISIDDLTILLWGESTKTNQQATILLLRLTAAARAHPNDFPLIPHRLHFLIRAPQGLSACLNQACTGPASLLAEGIGCLQPPRDRCEYCKSVALPVHRCRACGQWALAGHETPEAIESGDFAELSERRYYLVVSSGRRNLPAIVVNPETGEYSGGGPGTRLFRAPCPVPEHGTSCLDPECVQQTCPNCGTSWSAPADDTDDNERTLQIQAFRGAERLALSVATETVLYGMPVYPDISRDWKPGKGRRLLCFSDSRREAARLGPLLTTQHETWVVRSAMARALASHESPSVAYLTKQIRRHQADAEDVSLSNTDRHQAERALENLRNQLSDADSGIPFADFARSFAAAPEISEILDRELGEKHSEWRQERWKENQRSVASHAEALIAQELDNPLRTAISTESSGLLELVYPGLENLQVPAGLEERLPIESRDRIASAWPQILAALLDTVRADRAVGWSKEEPGRTWNEESPLYGRWSTRSKNGWTARRFRGDDDSGRPTEKLQLRLWFAKNVLAAAHCPESLSSALLDAAFSQMYDRATTRQLPWLRCEEHEVGRGQQDQAIQILLDQMRLRPPAALYRCASTGTLWPRAVLGWAPLKGCLGELRQITHKQADSDRRWGRPRRELVNFPIFAMGLWGEEHSAQLSPQENKRRQFLFKDGARNLLSSTTTMELGIDIGGLNGVVVGNVPPGPANHLQRAGRAGRRADGSSVVVTFARNRAFDREVFLRFRDFLARPLRRPLIFLDRQRFVRRHLHAMLLAEFFAPMQSARTGAMDAYSSMGKLCGGDYPPKWTGSTKPDWSHAGLPSALEFIRFLEALVSPEHPVRQRSRQIVEGTPLGTLADDDQKWAEFLRATEVQFLSACGEWQDNYDSLRSAWVEIPRDSPPAMLPGERAKANSIRYQLGAIAEISVIEWFSDSGFLPRYGFPIHLQRLSVRIPKEGKTDKSSTAEGYRLERTSLLALSEYVPGAQVLVGGKLVESKGILKHWTEANRDEALGLNHWALRCLNGHDYLATSQEEKCKECGEPPENGGQALMFPRFGYTTAAWDPPKPPGRNLDRVGEVVLSTAGGFTLNTATKTEDRFGGVAGLTATYYEAGAGQLLLRNAGGDAWSKAGHGFAVCTRCGFAMSEEKPSNGKKSPALPKNFADHPSVFSSSPMTRCWQRNLPSDPVLRHKVLAAKETTDVLILDWPEQCDEGPLFSLGRALVLAGARLLELDSRELNLELKARADGERGILLYDTTPGGSGHCFELLALGRPWLEEAQRILRGSPSHDTTCSRACLECLLDFGGQFHAHLLDRKAALGLLDGALGL
jgi:Lhr-like helicase